MNRLRYAITSLMLLLLTACPATKDDQRKKNSVTIVGEDSDPITVSHRQNSAEIYYEGIMNKKAIDEVKRYLDEDSNVKTLVINSHGGEVTLGMMLGNYVFDNDLDVRVEGVCFSSCANYVFTAAERKFVKKNATVGYHGGVEYDPDMKQEDYPELFVGLNTEEEKKKKWEDYKEYVLSSYQAEGDFFEKIGVDRRVTNIGTSDKYDDLTENEDYVGFTYTKEQFERLGVKPIILLDGVWEPNVETPKLFFVDF